MRTNWSRGVGRVALSVVVMAVLCGGVKAESDPFKAPVNPAFLERVKDGKMVKAHSKTASGRALGHVPSPVLLGKGILKVPKAGVSYQATFDVRTVGKGTPVKDQGSYGTCWTFGTCGSVESNLMPTTPIPNFSQNNIANNAGFDNNYNAGGDYQMAVAYLARWAGPVNASEDPYPDPGFAPPPSTPVQKHLQNSIFLPARTSYTGNDAIKEMLTTHGACDVSYYHDDAYYNDETDAFYYTNKSGEQPESANHEVTLIGWDDNFDAKNFLLPPPGNGAFLIQNSWSEDWGDKGCFWLSYYDKSFCDVVCHYDSQAPTNFAGISQYDPLGLCGSYGSASTLWGANIFTAGSGDPIQAVSTYATSSSCSCTVSIYTGVTAGSPTSGTLAGSASATFTYPGYYTIPLTTSVAVNKDELFSVVIKYTTPGHDKPLPIQCAVEGYSSASISKGGRGFHSVDGSAWTDMHTTDSSANVCIKAFGPAPSEPVMGIAYHATLGSEFNIPCPAGEFAAAPKVYITGGSLGDKQKPLKILTSKSEYPCATVRCAWTTKLAAGNYSLCVKRKSGKVELLDVVSKAFIIEDPEVAEFSDEVSGDAHSFDITGLNFGSVKPKFYLKYSLNGKEGKVSCKVETFDTNSMTASVKESALDKLRDKGVDAFYLIVENAIGKDENPDNVIE